MENWKDIEGYGKYQISNLGRQMKRPEPEYLSINDVAAILSISQKTIRGWIGTGKCPFTFNKIGGNLRIRKTALEAYLKRNEINQKS